ncbi:MAG TPA: hypothetical protein DDW49_02670 [Deltaproteobacteria bacterium]|nr:hypothetical protein [Deltaproteobacteria bacterium]
MGEHQVRPSWRGWAEESQDIEREKDRKRDISQGQGVVGRVGTEYGSQGPPGARVVGSVDSDDQMNPVSRQVLVTKKVKTGR